MTFTNRFSSSISPKIRRISARSAFSLLIPTARVRGLCPNPVPLLTTTYHLLLTTNYVLLTTYYYLLPALIQDISHDQITESRSCGPDDATAAADAADAAAATTAADAADAAAANAEAGLSWGRVQHVQLDRSRTI